MGHGRDKGASRGLIVYGLLVELYPRGYLRRHRAELLLNFRDLERESLSQAALWRFIAKDLAVSLWAEFRRTLWGQTAVRFAILGLMLAVVHRHPGEHERAVWTFCCGYVPGWFSGWLGRSSPGGSPRFYRSFRGQAAMLAGATTLVLAAAPLVPALQDRLVFASCYGAALAWCSGWWANYQRMRAQARP
jgi:hypothetical protein